MLIFKIIFTENDIIIGVLVSLFLTIKRFYALLWCVDFEQVNVTWKNREIYSLSEIHTSIYRNICSSILLSWHHTSHFWQQLTSDVTFNFGPVQYLILQLCQALYARLIWTRNTEVKEKLCLLTYQCLVTKSN